MQDKTFYVLRFFQFALNLDLYYFYTDLTGLNNGPHIHFGSRSDLEPDFGSSPCNYGLSCKLVK